MITDYACPVCRRVRRRKGRAASIFKCSCVGGELIECPRVRWDLADWTLLDQKLADILGVGVHVVRAKRAKLRRKPGTVGRKAHRRPVRRIDPLLIDLAKTNRWNAEALGCSSERIRQLREELKHTKP